MAIETLDAEAWAELTDLLIAAKDLADQQPDDQLKVLVDRALYRLGQVIGQYISGRPEPTAQ